METPNHYDNSITPLEFMEATFTHEEYRGFLKGNVIKYLARAEKKNKKEDYQKALHYSELLNQYLNK